MTTLDIEHVREYFLKLGEPRTLEEVVTDLSGTAIPSAVEETLQELVISGVIETKQLCEGCTVFCAPLKSSRKRFNTPVAGVKQRAKLAFKSPAKVWTPTCEREGNLRKTSPDTNPEDVARAVLKLKSKLETVQREIKDLSEDYHEDELQVHIDKLHEYNEVKDAGQILLGKIAEVEGTTTAAVYERFGLDLTD